MSSLSPEKALIFRITHIANVPVGSSNPNVLSPNSFGVARPGLGQALPWIRTSVRDARSMRRDDGLDDHAGLHDGLRR